MGYTKYYSLETIEGDPIIEGYDLNVVRAEKENIPNAGNIYEYDVDEENPEINQRIINKTLVE